MNAGGAIAIIVILSLLLGFGGYTVYARLRANRLGLPPPPLFNPFARSSSTPDYAAPSPAPHNPLTWISSKIASFRNQRTAGGAYESTTSYPSGGARGGGEARRGFGPLDPDEAWDSRVENEIGGGYYEGEDVELGQSGPGPYGGSGYGGSGYAEPGVGVGGRGRSRDRQREVDERYAVETGRAPAKNPFGDDAATESLRGVSPRPHMQDTEYRGAASGGQKGKVAAVHKKGDSVDDSPTERRSMFTEDV